MSLIRINRNPSGRQLAVFGLAWLGVLGLSGWASWQRGRHSASEIIWVAAVAVPMAGLFSRRLLRLAYLGLSYVTYPAGYVISHAVLALVYFLVLTPIGLAMRLFGYDPLCRGFDPKAPSYWRPRVAARPAESYFHQD